MCSVRQRSLHARKERGRLLPKRLSVSMNVEEGPVCREHGGSMYVAAAEVQAGSGCVTFQAAGGWTGRRGHMIVIRVASM